KFTKRGTNKSNNQWMQKHTNEKFTGKDSKINTSNNYNFNPL
ncbi:46362_t:CDS:1, partial [Gigaspora margarita]